MYTIYSIVAGHRAAIAAFRDQSDAELAFAALLGGVSYGLELTGPGGNTIATYN